jgi:D-proline reductase (dithiol) PrdB
MAAEPLRDEHVEADPAHRVFVSYIDKSREFYLAQGYGNPYRWAHNPDVPFAPLAKPLAESRVALVTTATLIEGWGLDDPEPDPEAMPQPGPYAAPIDPPPARLYTQHRSWDKEATHTRDLDSFFPVHRLQELVESGRIGSLSPRFYGVPTDYSQRRTNEHDAPQVLEWMREDGVDVAMLVPL